jgi:hypothetical protein
VAIGDYILPSTAEARRTGEGLLLVETRGTWAATEAPLPDGLHTIGADGRLTEVTCPSVGSCVAIGQFDDPNGDPTPLVEMLG